MFEPKINRGASAFLGMIDANGYLITFPAIESSRSLGNDVATFVACGDMGPVRKLESIAARGGSAQILGEIGPVLKEADFVFANIEATFSERGTPMNRVPVFRLAPSAFDIVRQANVKIASLANNHMSDYGPDAFSDTIDLLTKNKIKYFGAGLTPSDALRPSIIEIKNIKFGFIGFRDGGSENYPDNGVMTPNIHKKHIIDAVTRLKKKVDWVIVSLHFGLEYKFCPCPSDVRLCRELIDGGVNIVLGHHPHYPQGLEEYCDGLIVYSLGNFVWNQNFVGHTSSSYILQISVTKKKMHAIKVIPFCMSKDYQLKLNMNSEAITEIEKLSAVLVDEKLLDEEWYFITRDLFQLLCKELWKICFSDHRNPVAVYRWTKQLGLRQKNALKCFFKYILQCKAFKYEIANFFEKWHSR